MDKITKLLITSLFENQQIISEQQVRLLKQSILKDDALESKFQILARIIDYESQKDRQEALDSFREIISNDEQIVEARKLIAQLETQLEHLEAQTKSLLSGIETND